jgi:hypothetical protein
MTKKFGKIKVSLLIGLLLIGIFTAMMPSTSAGKIIGLSSLVNVTWGDQLDEPIIPRQDIVQVDLNVNYSITSGWFISNFVYRFLVGRQVNIELEITESPSWCEASLTQETLTTTLKKDINETQKLSTKIAISVDKDAPAFAQGKITINASVEPIKGILGFRDIIDGYSQEFDIPFQPGYLPLFSVEPSINETLKIPPYNETIIPINITNEGNAKTKILAEIIEAPENWTVSIENLTLNAFDGSGQTNLKVFADHKFDVETIKIKFTPAYFDDNSYTGSEQVISLSFENDGSYVEEDEKLEIDSTMLIVILTVILAIIIVIAVISKLRKPKN